MKKQIHLAQALALTCAVLCVTGCSHSRDSVFDYRIIEGIGPSASLLDNQIEDVDSSVALLNLKNDSVVSRLDPGIQVGNDTPPFYILSQVDDTVFVTNTLGTTHRIELISIDEAFDFDEKVQAYSWVVR